MRKITKYGLALLFVLVSFLGSNVYAEEIYYTNSKGVSFTKEQYDFYTYLTHDGYQEQVTQEMLDEIAGQDLDSLDVKVVRLCPNEQKSQLRSTYNTQDDRLKVETSAKSLSMAKYCTPYYCRVLSELEWLGEPNSKSYDLMGAYLDGPTRLAVPTTSVVTTSGSKPEETIKYDTNGFGAVIKLPNESDPPLISQSFMYSGTGVIFVSYQHAMSSISLADAQLFNIGLIGYGSVFDFYGVAADIYDQMPGVYMTV